MIAFLALAVVALVVAFFTMAAAEFNLRLRGVEPLHALCVYWVCFTLILWGLKLGFSL